MTHTNPTRTVGEPHERMTRLCAAMTDALEAHSEYTSDVHGAIFLKSGTRAGLVMHGYDDDREAIADVLVHLTAIFEANGMRLELIGIPNDTSGLE